MTHQQLVFKNTPELVHSWANQAQDEGCSGIMSFRARHIYSYAMMIASFRGADVVFLNAISRSSTTNRHQKAVRSACSGDLTVFEYNSIPNWCGEVAKLQVDPCNVAPSEIWNQYRDIWFSLAASAFQRRFKCTASKRLALASAYAEKANSIAMLFTLDCSTLSALDIDSGIAELIDAENARKEHKRRIAALEQCIQECTDWVLPVVK